MFPAKCHLVEVIEGIKIEGVLLFTPFRETNSDVPKSIIFSEVILFRKSSHYIIYLKLS